MPSPFEPPPRSARAPVLLVLALVLAAFAVSRLAIAGIPTEREYDEGVYLLSARAVASGHELFRTVFSSQPPAFLESLAVALRIFGDRLETGRGLILAFSMLAMLAIADVGRRIAGPWAATTAAAALALTATFGDLAHFVQAETPAVAVALAALAVCLESRSRAWHRGWLLASGALLALGALFKLMVVPLAAPLGLLLLLAPASGDESEWRLDTARSGFGWRVAGRSVVVAAGAALVLAVPLLFYDVEALYRQTVAFHLNKHDAFQWNAASNFKRAVGRLRVDWPVSVTAAAGLLLLAVRGRVLVAAWLAAWLIAMLGVIVAQTPLFWRHFVLLSPPIAIAAAIVVLASPVDARRRAATAVVVISLWTGLTLVSGHAMFPLLSDGVRHERSHATLLAAARWIAMNTAPDEFVGGDDPMAIYLGGRQAPPKLCDTSSSRIVSGSLRVEEAARESLAARVILLRAGGRLSKLPGYREWLRRNYDARASSLTGLGPGRTAWIRRQDASADVVNPPSPR